MGITAAIGSALGASAANAAAVGAAAISTATAVASTAATYVGQQQQADAQADYQQKVNEQITQATMDNYAELTKAESDVLYNSAQDSLQNQIGAIEAMSQAQAQTSALGVGGRSSDAVLSNIARKKAVADTDIRMAREQQLANIEANAESLRQGAQASYDVSPIKKPSIWQAAAKGASVGANTFQSSVAFDKVWRDSSSVGTGV